MYQIYPRVGEVEITDSFWCAYLREVRETMLPYVFEKMEESGYMQNYISVAKKDGNKHIGLPFYDGLFLEAVRGACDFLSAQEDFILENYIDQVIKIIASAQAEDGYLCTQTMQDYPDKRWGDNDGDIVEQHDLYNHGTLIEAAISHYKATGKTTLLSVAVKAANLICSEIGYEPKKNIIPGHSLPEEAFVKLYRLFVEDNSLKSFAEANNVNPIAYLDMAEFWYDERGNHKGRFLAKRFSPEYNQDHITFAKQDTAEGHSVRAMLCYLGATVVAKEKDRQDYFEALEKLWNSVVYKKLHISGGIGARHDIEGFSEDYFLPNSAYLETCAAIGLAFWNTEMNLVMPDSKYFDVFEQSLYNNIMSGIGADFKHFFYQNPLSSDGTLQRWDWHVCPCCPPMLLKIFASLSSFIYSYSSSNKTLNINMFIGSSYENDLFRVEQLGKKIVVDSKGNELTLRIRIPDYIENFTVKVNGEDTDFRNENGYAVFSDVFTQETNIELSFDMPIRRIYANPKVEENIGKIAVMHGPFVMCAEGIDNNGNVDIEVAENPLFEKQGDFIIGTASNGSKFTLIPYGKWCNRGKNQEELKMSVWLKQEKMIDTSKLVERIGDKLYGNYNKVIGR